MKRLIVVLLLAGLTACATTQPMAPQFLSIPEECRAATPTKPQELYGPPYVSLHTATAHLLGDREATAGYIRKLETALAACKQIVVPETTKPTQP